MAKKKSFAVMKGIAVYVASNAKDDYSIWVEVVSFTVNEPKKVTHKYSEQHPIIKLNIPHSSQNSKWLKAVASGASLKLYVDCRNQEYIVTGMDCILPTTEKLESVLKKLKAA